MRLQEDPEAPHGLAHVDDTSLEQHGAQRGCDVGVDGRPQRALERVEGTADIPRTNTLEILACSKARGRRPPISRRRNRNRQGLA